MDAPACSGAALKGAVRLCAVRSGPASPGVLFDVLNLLSHLLDEHLQLHRRGRDAGVDGFGCDGVGFPVELLHHEVQFLAAGAALLQNASDLADMGGETVDLLGDVKALGDDDELL